MSWALGGANGSEKLIEYEKKLNDFFPKSKTTAICQYNENKFSPEVLIYILNTHPYAIIYGDLFENYTYSSILDIKKAAEPALYYNDYSEMKKAIMNHE
jgi:hypothetical protein